MHITVHNAAHGLSSGLAVLLTQAGPERPSRNGPVRAMNEPLTVTYQNPDQRVLFYPEREANPFFHLYECLWMLAGKRDVRSVAKYVPGMRNFSDDGQIFNGAYGHRWRFHWQGMDQVKWAIKRLSDHDLAFEDRRCYVSMWDPRRDTQPSRDIPCNVGIAFRCRSDGRLDMTVFNRSNDLVLGAFGANVVHMSFLHEFVARAAGLPLGQYHQVTNDMHIYLEHDVTPKVIPLAGTWTPEDDPYLNGQVSSYPVMETHWEEWFEDLDLFLKFGNVVGLRDRFFRRVAGPVVLAHDHYRENKGEERYTGAIEILEQCLAADWKRACQEWMLRRLAAWQEKSR